MCRPALTDNEYALAESLYVLAYHAAIQVEHLRIGSLDSFDMFNGGCGALCEWTNQANDIASSSFLDGIW